MPSSKFSISLLLVMTGLAAPQDEDETEHSVAWVPPQVANLIPFRFLGQVRQLTMNAQWWHLLELLITRLPRCRIRFPLAELLVWYHLPRHEFKLFLCALQISRMLGYPGIQMITKKITIVSREGKASEAAVSLCASKIVPTRGASRRGSGIAWFAPRTSCSPGCRFLYQPTIATIQEVIPSWYFCGDRQASWKCEAATSTCAAASWDQYILDCPHNRSISRDPAAWADSQVPDSMQCSR